MLQDRCIPTALYSRGRVQFEESALAGRNQLTVFYYPLKVCSRGREYSLGTCSGWLNNLWCVYLHDE